MCELWATIRRAASNLRRKWFGVPQVEEVTHNVYAPIEEHLREGNPELGDKIIRLAKKYDVPMTFDLIRLSPNHARAALIENVAIVMVRTKEIQNLNG